MALRGRTVVAAAVIFAVAIALRRGAEPADDGAFVLRYAAHMAGGEFWVWNPGEPPVWGASAPLWPLLPAVGIALGLDPLTALQGIGAVLGVAALTGSSAWLGRHGALAALCFVGFAAADSALAYHMTAGLETPLTLALLTLGLHALDHPRLLGLAAGLLMIHKVDLLPAGVGLLVAAALRDRRVPWGSVAQAGALCGAGYAAAGAYFGVVTPLPLWTKLMRGRSIEASWFAVTVLATSGHRWLSLLALGARRDAWVLFPLSILASHLVAYSLRPPMEPYGWYTVPSSWALLTLAASGAARLGDRAPTVAGAILLGLLALQAPVERAATARQLAYVRDVETPRAAIGRWIAANTPADALLQSPWGLPAWYGGRRVLDSSFLNERPGTVRPRPDLRVEAAEAPAPVGYVQVHAEGPFVVWALP